MRTNPEDEKILDKIKLHTTVQQEMNEAVALINMYDPKGELWGNPERNKEFCKRLEEAMQKKQDKLLTAGDLVHLKNIILGNCKPPFQWDWAQD